MRPIERTEVDGVIIITAADSSPIARATLRMQLWEAMDSVLEEESAQHERDREDWKGHSHPGLHLDSAHHAP